MSLSRKIGILLSVTLPVLSSSLAVALPSSRDESHSAIQTDTQTSELVEKARKLESLERLQPQLRLLLTDAVAELRAGIEKGPPFLLDERRARVEKLEKLLNDPDAIVAEQFRRVVEAYRVELDYAKTVDAYRDILKIGKDERLVDFLSIGRLALYYQTPDGRESGIWRSDRREWQRLSGEGNEAVAQGLRIARKLEPPQLLILPMPGPRSK